MGLRKTLPDRRMVRGFFYSALLCIVMCIIYTKSRGALFTLVITMITASLLSGKPIRNALIVTVLVSSAYWFVPEYYFDRLSTLENLEGDESFLGRIENWTLAWRAALDNPIFGVGLDNHILYNRAIQPGVQVRVAHSVYFQVLGELGFPGLLLYLCFIGLGLLTLFRTWRALVPVASANPELAWTRDLAFWMTCGYTGYIVGSGFLNMLYIEFPWYVIFYGSMLWPLVRQELTSPESNNTAILTV
jgi:probable O-glycosylation ligase (exosortase A-associated)